MKKQFVEQIFFWCLVAGLLNSSCTSITGLFPQANRPFQPGKFDSAQWKSGDYQTRGEMTRDLIYDVSEKIRDRSADEIRQLLGKPDEITRAACCHARYDADNEVELWLYYIEIERDVYKDGGKLEKEMVKEAVKIYFGGRNSGVLNAVTGDRNGDHSYFPIVG